MSRTFSFFSAIALLGTALLLSPACASLTDDLHRAEVFVEDIRFEEAETCLADLEPRHHEMDSAQRAKYHFLRGVVAQRLNDTRAVLYHMSVAREAAGPENKGLRNEWVTVMNDTITAQTNPRATAPEPARPADPDTHPDADETPQSRSSGSEGPSAGSPTNEASR